jgi:glycosyltransferase involved in cell wall biosynthesis
LSERVRHILFFHPHFRDGGVERGMVLLTREFRTLGVRSEVATFGTVGHFAGVADAPPFVDLGARRALTSLFPLARHLRRTRPDWVVSAQNFANVIAVLANILAGRPSKVLVTERNAVSRERVLYAGRLGMGKLKSRILLRVMRWIYPLADRVAANSADGAKDLADTIGMPLSRVKVLYNPTFDPRILEEGQAETSHPFFRLSAESQRVPVVIAVGRLAPQKDFATLIRAFALVRARRACHLLILGEGPDRPALEALAQDLGVAADVSLPGFSVNPHADVRRADLFVLSSLFEGLPNALIEAVALGVPCVSTDCLSGPREILLDGRGGPLVPVGDPERLAAAMLESLENPERARALLSNARSGLYRFDSRTAAKAYLLCMEGQ